MDPACFTSGHATAQFPRSGKIYISFSKVWKNPVGLSLYFRVVPEGESDRLKEVL